MKLSDIAKKANVSVSTVSKAFADSKEINEETRKEILSIAKEMGVYDKYYKGKYNRKIIAIIAPELKSQFYYAVISAFNEIFDRYDCTIVVSVTNFDREVQSELIRYYATFGHSDGIIVIGKPKLPEISLEITEGGRHELMERLREDRVDMVFLPHSAPLEQNYSALKIARIPIVCCATKNNPISSLSSVRPTDLADTPLVLFENSFFQTEKIKRWFSESGVTPKIILQTELLSTMLSVLSKEIAVGFMFRPLIEASPNLIPIPTDEPMCVDVSLVWKKDAYLFYSMKTFRDYVKANPPFRQS